ncbi:Protein of unknown function with HXXEE motif-containing protein [Evansella caseinilytica]|uniref:HXXEE domain-containing protein n=1 Tax=Evansella caseinilytica TaxID=1503961 RepID=A0A1H3GLB9_9BACI|nr:HXXEE domain-containing protein [Evansella caseinilytica]SDY03079.1 Protein of unknown function with HXXEE motif-containing protein [Evansella caseinilytica]
MEPFVILFLFSITLHNLEEALWLPAWSRTAGKFQKPVSPDSFYFAVIVITSLAYLSALFYFVQPSSVIAKYLLVGFIGSMIVNAVFPHLAATIAFKKYAPGVLTGALLNIPVNSLIIYQFFRRDELTAAEFIASTAVIGLLLLISIPLLFRLGSSATRQFR